MADHAVVRTDLMYGTDVRTGLVSIKYMGSDGETPTEIDNGNVLKVDSLMEGESEVYIGVDVSSSDAITDVVLIASPEVMYDEHKRSLDEFVNEADDICRGYRLHTSDVFSVTAEALDGTPEVGSSITLADGTKLAVDGTGTTVGTVIAIDIVGRYTYYAIKVD